METRAGIHLSCLDPKGQGLDIEKDPFKSLASTEWWEEEKTNTPEPPSDYFLEFEKNRSQPISNDLSVFLKTADPPFVGLNALSLSNIMSQSSTFHPSSEADSQEHHPVLWDTGSQHPDCLDCHKFTCEIHGPSSAPGSPRPSAVVAREAIHRYRTNISIDSLAS